MFLYVVFRWIARGLIIAATRILCSFFIPRILGKLCEFIDFALVRATLDACLMISVQVSFK
jgi:hypothetical protein